MRKWFVALLCLLLPFTASATILGVQQGGTGSSTLSGILIGNGINPVNTLTVGSGLTLTGTTLTSTGGGGTPGGLNLQVQYNNAGSFGGISGAVTNGTILNLTNPLLGGATLTTSVVNGVTLTAAGSATTYLNGTGAYTTPVGTVYTGTFPVSVSGTVISFGGLATSTAAVLGNIPYFSGVNTFANVATGTISNGTGISVTAGQSVIGSGLTITNSGVTSIVAGTNVTISGATGAVTINATGGGSSYPFTPSTDGGINTSATSTPIQGTNPGLGLDVSATSWYGIGGQLLAYASSTNFATIFGLRAGGQLATTSNSSREFTAVGYEAGMGGPSGTFDTALGYTSLLTSATGGNNTAIGAESIQANTGGSFNTALGVASLETNTGGSSNTAIGYNALGSGTTGNRNIALGLDAGIGVLGDGNIIIGSNVTVPVNANSSQLNIGNVLYGLNMYNAAGSAVFAPTSNGSIGVGSTTPFAKFAIHTNNGDTTQVLFAIGSSTQTATTTLFSIDRAGHIATSGTAPAITACGTNPSFIGPANDTDMTINIGSGVVSSCTITYAQAYPLASTVGCSLTQIGGSFATSIEASSTQTAVIISGNTITSDRYYLHCEASQ